MNSRTAIARRRFIGVELWRWVAFFATFYVVAVGGTTLVEAGILTRIIHAAALGFVGGSGMMWLANYQEADSR